MWEPGAQNSIIHVPQNYNDVARALKGDLEDMEAKLTLIQFLKRNLGFTFELISGMRLLAIQEVILKSLFLRDNGLVVAGRGLGKSTIIAMFCTLFPIFYPKSKICLISANFRGSRRIFEEAEKMVKGPAAKLLQDCFPTDPRKLNDILSWKMENGSEIFALPLSNGEGLRGTRASVVFVDEGLLISEEIQKKVIRPFLTANQNYLEETEIKEAEDELIKAGQMTEADRVSFPRNKYLVCSSASYDFDYLYTIYQEYISNIIDPSIKRDPKKSPTYFVMRASYAALPEDSFIDLAAIESAKANGGEDSDYFLREYCARFSNGGDSYFGMKRMKECTVPDSESPTTQLKGKKDAKYILAIDPSYSASKASDFFAMGVYQLVPEERRIILVHSYGRSGMTLNDHYNYLIYLLQNFNIVWVSIDASGTEFTDSFNESALAIEKGIKLGYLKAELYQDDTREYEKQMRLLKNEYNQTSRNIVYPQLFSGDQIRRMNEYLQAGINSKRVWWASRLEAHEEEFKKACANPPDFNFFDTNNRDMALGDAISDQDEWIHQTKKQLTLIEVKTTTMGTMQFDLPAHIRKSTSITKPRKDNYTCLLMGYSASRFYFDMISSNLEPEQVGFVPFALA